MDHNENEAVDMPRVVGVERLVAPGDSPSEEVVRAVAEFKEVEPTALGALFDRVDPSEIDALFDGSRGSDEDAVVARFTMAECIVTVRSDRLVSVRGIEGSD